MATTSFKVVQQYLNQIIGAWMAKRGGRPADITGVHADPSMGWVTKEQLANSKPFDEYQLIAPGVKGKESNLYKALALPSGVDSNGRMPVGGPYMTAEQTDYIAAWIDEKMPD